jgi:RNA polymerase sigma factor (sigma-70 family)
MKTEQKLTLLSQWVEDYTDDLLNWAYLKTSNLALAEGLTQDTFLVAHQRIDHFRKESAPKTWLFAILKNKIIDHYRKQFKTPASVDINHFREEGFTPFDSDEKWISHHAPVHWESNDQHLLCPARRNCSQAYIRPCVALAKVMRNNLDT